MNSAMNSTRTPRKTVDLLERVRITESERRAAREYLRQGELIADFIVAATAAIRHVAHSIERGIRVFVRTRSTN